MQKQIISSNTDTEILQCYRVIITLQLVDRLLSIYYGPQTHLRLAIKNEIELRKKSLCNIETQSTN